MSEREKLIDVLSMSTMSDYVGTNMSPIEKTASEILDSDWLASVKADAWQEGRNVGIDNAYDSVFTRNPYRGADDE